MKMRAVIIFTLLSFVFIALPMTGCSTHPKITMEAIQKDIVGKNTDEGQMSWLFDEREPREISILESNYDGDKATIIIDIKTESRNWAGTHRMAGKLRLHYEWITKEWNLIRIENLTFKSL